MTKREILNQFTCYIAKRLQAIGMEHAVHAQWCDRINIYKSDWLQDNEENDINWDVIGNDLYKALKSGLINPNPLQISTFIKSKALQKTKQP